MSYVTAGAAVAAIGQSPVTSTCHNLSRMQATGIKLSTLLHWRQVTLLVVQYHTRASEGIKPSEDASKIVVVVVVVAGRVRESKKEKPLVVWQQQQQQHQQI